MPVHKKSGNLLNAPPIIDTSSLCAFSTRNLKQLTMIIGSNITFIFFFWLSDKYEISPLNKYNPTRFYNIYWNILQSQRILLGII